MAAAPPHPLIRHGRLELLLAIAALVFALPRVARGFVLMGDSAELVAASRVWGVPRAPGHALYVALGHLASVSGPADSLVWRVHATSALYHAIAIAFVAGVTHKLTRSAAAAVCSAAFLLFSRNFLLGSLYADVVALSDAFFAATLWAALEASVRPAETRWRWLALTALLAGAGAGHDPQLLFGLPTIVLLIARPWVQERRETPLRTLALLGVFLVPILLSLGLLWLAARRDTLVSYGDARDWRSFWDLALRRDYGGLFGTGRHLSPDTVGERVGAMALSLGQSIGAQGVVTAAIGSFALVRRERRTVLALLVAFLLLGPFQAALVDSAIEGEARVAVFTRLFGPLHVPLAILSGVGALAVVRRLEKRLESRWKMPPVAVAGLVVLPPLLLLPSALSVDLSRDRFGGAMVRDVLDSVPKGALVLVAGDVYTTAADAACAVDDACGDFTVVAPVWLHLPWARRQLARRHPDVVLPEGNWSLSRLHELIGAQLQERPVLVAPGLFVHDRSIMKRFRFVSHGMLLRVYASEADARKDRAEQVATLARVTDGSACRGCLLDPKSAFRPSQHLEVVLAYSVTLDNAARFASRIGARSENQVLAERAVAFDRAVGFDMLSLTKTN
jgi:hypothetical protein